MKQTVVKIERLFFVCNADDIDYVLELCSLKRYVITEIRAVRDGRSGNYTGELEVVAERDA